MKLELRYLVPYLPYGLKAKLSQEGVLNLDIEYRNEYAYSICTITDFTTYSKDLGGSMKVDKTKDYSFDFDSLSEIEIILRPLSDLTKEIEHKGEKFVPIDVLELEGFVVGWNGFEITIGQEAGYSFGYAMDVYNNIIQKLLEWNFDIFGLIENNLAVDINTL